MVELTWMTCLTGDGRTDLEDRVDIGDMTNQADKGREAEIDRVCKAFKDISLSFIALN